MSSIDLLVAVSEAGGLGSFGAHHLPGTEIEALAAAIRARTSKPFALNLWVGDHDGDGLAPAPGTLDRAFAALKPYFDELGLDRPPAPERYGQRFDRQIDHLLRAAPPVFSFVFGIPPAEVLRACRQRGIRTIGAATTPDEAEALDEAGVDLIVATGFEAGGHRVSFLRGADDSLYGTLALVPLAADRVRAPVIAAGGIADARGVRAALALGASAVQVGTAFLACDESAAPAIHRDRLFGPMAGRTALTRAFSGRLARGIENRMLAEMRAHAGAIAPYPAQNWLAGQLKKAAVAAGRNDLMSLWCGQGAGLLRHRKAAALVAELAEGALSG